MPGSVNQDPLGTRGKFLGKRAYSSRMIKKPIEREETGEMRVSRANRPRTEASQTGVKHLPLKVLAKRGLLTFIS